MTLGTTCSSRSRATERGEEVSSRGVWTKISCGERGLTWSGRELTKGAGISELRVTPDRYLTIRYAGASGDFNPIHLDEEFARSVGLPGRILHGLWTMAQVGRGAH